jgi:hypothetical protein
MVISWGNGIKSKGETRYQFSHVIDIAPTILEAVGITPPVEIDGIAQKPIEGVSLVYSFEDKDVPTRHNTQYFEMLGNQGIYHDGWMASAFYNIPWNPNPSEKDVLNLDWELYDITSDFSQAEDLADEKPEKVEEMKKLFYAEAAKYNVLPLDGRKTERLNVELRPSLTAGRTNFTYPDKLRITEGSAPDVKHKNHTITADVVIPDGGAEGVLLTHGGRFGGYVLYVKDGKLTYHYNLAGVDNYSVVSDKTVPTGKVTLKAVYKTDEDKPFSGGQMTLYANNRKIGEGRIEKTLPNRISIDETVDVGFDTGTPVTNSYQLPFDFTGNLEQVTVSLD